MIALLVLKRSRLRKILARIGGLDGLKNLKIDEDFSGLSVGRRRFRTEESAKSYLGFLQNHAGRAVRETPEYELGLFVILVLIWQLAIVAIDKVNVASFADTLWPSLIAYGLAATLTLVAFGSLAKNRQGGYIPFFTASLAVAAVLEAAGLLHMPGVVSGTWGQETPMFHYILANWIADADRAHMWDFSDPKALVFALWCLCLWALASISKALHRPRSSRSHEIGMLNGEHEHP
ncbi:MAG: hypothetical protein KIT00_05165 [Rhodospirillales bacterium]|nr:hypothetical protein [Rhodospirillales bacterium]